MNRLARINRILTLDLMRGYFLIVIILNHLHYYPSGLEWFTGQSYLYASTAEGFFIVSGIVLGIVRGAKLIDKPFWLAAKKLVQRGFQLYIISIILVLLFTFFGWLFIDSAGLKFGIFHPSGNVFELIWKTVSLQYIYGWADYLRLYAIFILASPVALWLLRRGLWYVVLLVSVLIWSLYAYVPTPSGSLSQPFSWQLIFFIGFIIGFHAPGIKTWWRNLKSQRRRAIIATTITLAIVTMIANVLIVFGRELPYIGSSLIGLDEYLSTFFNKDQLPLPRLLLAGTWFAALYFVVAHWEKRISKAVGWLLLPLGTNSLYVYTIQAFIVFIALIIFEQPSKYWFINLAISLGVVGLVYAAVRTKFLMKIIPR